MKSNKKSGHVEPSPLTYTKKGFSRPRFIVTVFLTVVISLSLIVGGTMTFFGVGNDYFFTVNDRELITPDILDAIHSQVNQPGISEQQKLSMLMQALGPREQSFMWIFYGERGGIDFKVADLYDALRKSYEEQKQSYQEEFKSYYTLPYLDFVKNNVDTFNLQATIKALITPNAPDEYNIAREYAVKNLSSVVEYRYTDLNTYLLKTQQENILKFYEAGDDKVISGKTVLVLPFSSDSQANVEANNMEKDPEMAKTRFEAATQTVNINKNSDPEAYLYVQSVDVGQITPSFVYRGKFYVGKVTGNQYVPFNRLDSKEQSDVANSYATSLKKTQVNQIRTEIRKELEENQSQPYILKGTTRPVELTNMTDVRDSRTSLALPFAAADNKQLLTYIFSDTDAQSPTLEYQNIYYNVRVIKKTKPVFPVPSSEYKTIQNAIKQREEALWSQFYSQQIQEKAKVKINTKALKQILQ